MKQQQGISLIVSLILMLLLGIMSVGAVQMATFDTRITGNLKSRDIAFQAAESALLVAERWVEEQNFNELNWKSSCAIPQDCFTQQCDQGLCFSGQFNEAASQAKDVCQLSPTEFHQEADNWSDGDRHQLITENTLNAAQNARFIVEFYCYVPANNDLDLDLLNTILPPDPSHWKPLYRITALGFGRDEETRVMLQSTYRPES